MRTDLVDHRPVLLGAGLDLRVEVREAHLLGGRRNESEALPCGHGAPQRLPGRPPGRSRSPQPRPPHEDREGTAPNGPARCRRVATRSAPGRPRLLVELRQSPIGSFARSVAHRHDSASDPRTQQARACSTPQDVARRGPPRFPERRRATHAASAGWLARGGPDPPEDAAVHESAAGFRASEVSEIRYLGRCRTGSSPLRPAISICFFSRFSPRRLCSRASDEQRNTSSRPTSASLAYFSVDRASVWSRKSLNRQRSIPRATPSLARACLAP
jgi:hypothetical protein